MEKRFTLAMVLCFLIVFLGIHYMAPPPQARKPVPAAPTAPSATGTGTIGSAPAPQDPAGQAATAPAPAAASRPEFPAKTWTWRNDVVEVEVTSRGAALARVALLAHREDEKQEPLTLIYPESAGAGALALDLGEAERYLAVEHWEVESESERSVAFRYPLPGGRYVRKSLQLPAQGYLFEAVISCEGSWDANAYYRLFGPERIRRETGGSGVANNRITAYATPNRTLADVVRAPVAAIPEQVPQVYRDPTQALWFGLESNYFAFVLRPLDGWENAPWSAISRQEVGKERKEPHLQPLPLGVGCERRVHPGVAHRYEAVFAPKDREFLAVHKDVGYDRLVDYGRLGFLVRLFLGLLSFFEGFTRSYGIAIIILTFLVKLVLHPINRKNQSIMMTQQKLMAKLQPQMQEIKERHKGDPLKTNREMQKLWQEHGLNPMRMFGGCLLIFIQLPIWIGLINTFSLALELRHRPFLWISDLTQPDRLFELPFTVPYMGWGHFNLLPVLYVIVTIISQKMMPKSADPQMQQQQKIMTFMMAMFGFIFYNFSAGLLIYFLTSALLGIAEQKIIKRELALKEARK